MLKFGENVKYVESENSSTVEYLPFFVSSNIKRKQNLSLKNDTNSETPGRKLDWLMYFHEPMMEMLDNNLIPSEHLA